MMCKLAFSKYVLMYACINKELTTPSNEFTKFGFDLRTDEGFTDDPMPVGEVCPPNPGAFIRPAPQC